MITTGSNDHVTSRVCFLASHDHVTGGRDRGGEHHRQDPRLDRAPFLRAHPDPRSLPLVACSGPLWRLLRRVRGPGVCRVCPRVLVPPAGAREGFP